ncbi:hypothetical protein AAVH_17523 [Aphelenchoides avenae]|nr:hypothetical protein AAVH_17523 [Aphelenchus avenae]
MNEQTKDGSEEINQSDNATANASLATKRKAENAPIDSASPAKMGKVEAVKEGTPHCSDTEYEFILDLDQAGEADFGVRNISQWSSGLRNVSVKVVFVKVKYDRAATNDKPAVYTIMIEDSSEASNICAFGDDAQRLKIAIAGLEGTQMLFSGLTARIPDANYARYLPGNVNFELNFNKFSEVKLVQHANTSNALEMLRDFSTAYGRQKANVRLVSLSHFKDFRPKGNPLFRGWASDGAYQVELEMHFHPPFQLGEEFDILGATPRDNGNKVYLTLSAVSDVVKIGKDNYRIERKLKGLKFLERP